tara:strand:- start:4549 stop:5430 length:882 start_codon:yes stop_codon:yes gene_type:complete
VNNKYDKKIGILDWSIFFAIIILITMVYVPLNVWAEENHYKEMRRSRMKYIASAEEFFYELTGRYTTNVDELFPLVEAAMDSLISDSTFTGKQVINLNNNVYEVMMDESFHIRVDTTYSKAEIIKTLEIDTLFKIGVRNEDNLSLIDTIWVNSTNFKEYENNPNFVDNYITHYENDLGNMIEVDEFLKDEANYTASNYSPKKVKYVDRVNKTRNFLRRKFHLESDFIYCPISKNNFDKKKFILNVDNSNPSTPVFSIESPLGTDDNELRYGIFRYRPGKKESIVGGVKSWAGE